jgi:triosephosphate isomerase
MLIIVNFKKYKKGKGVLSLAKLVGRRRKNSIVAVLPWDVERVSKVKGLRVFSQYVTATTLDKIKKDGAKGSLLNHSDHPVSISVIKKVISEARKKKMRLIVCSGTLIQIKEIKKLRPYAIAFEDKKLIGTGKSITKYKADDVAKFVKMLRGSGITPLCGAGISSAVDVREAKRLGCKGVLVASAVAKGDLSKAEKFLKSVR